MGRNLALIVDMEDSAIPVRVPDAIVAVFPQIPVQTCIVHLIRHSLALGS